MKDRRSKLEIRIAAIQRYFMWYYTGELLGHVRIAEFPKSGGTWLAQMVAEMSSLDFPRNRRMTISKGIQHSHLPGPVKNKKTILLIRDGRDIVVSAYYHFIIGHDKSPSFLNEKWRTLLDVEDINDIKNNLPKFIDVFFNHFHIGGRRLNWAAYMDSFLLDNPALLVIKYEDLLLDCKGQLRSVSNFLNLDISDSVLEDISDQYSFENMTLRQRGEEDTGSFLRKGIAGDWKEKFSREAELVFEDWGGEQLRRLGYDG